MATIYVLIGTLKINRWQSNEKMSKLQSWFSNTDLNRQCICGQPQSNEINALK